MSAAPLTALVRYDAMVQAIATAYEVDEVKDIRDKALAIEIYSRQAKNTENERRACGIRLRAERKAGQLLAETEKAKGARGIGRSAVARDDRTPKTLGEMGITKDQSANWQKLAAVPQEDFDEALAAPEKPSITGIIASTAPPPEQEAVTRRLTLRRAWERASEDQRGVLLGLLWNTLHAMETLTNEKVINLAEAAALVGVEPRLVALADVIRRYGTSEEMEAVEQGHATICSIVAGWESP